MRYRASQEAKSVPVPSRGASLWRKSAPPCDKSLSFASQCANSEHHTLGFRGLPPALWQRTVMRWPLQVMLFAFPLQAIGQPTGCATRCTASNLNEMNCLGRALHQDCQLVCRFLDQCPRQQNDHSSKADLEPVHRNTHLVAQPVGRSIERKF